MDIDKLTQKYFKDMDNCDSKLELAHAYYNQQLFAPASLFYQKVAEYSTDNSQIYIALIMCQMCYEKLDKRPTAEKSFLLSAIDADPHRPEAYFLISKLYEKLNDHQQSYYWCVMAENICNFSLSPLSIPCVYPGRYGITFQKAVAAYWIGKGQLSRDIFTHLLEKEHTLMHDSYYHACVRNRQQLGHGPDSKSVKQYLNDYHDRLKFKFKDSDKIVQNYAQVYQDMFVLYMLNGKYNGTYLEIGSAMPIKCNNTYLLEQRGWSGIGIEFQEHFVTDYNNTRKNKCLLANALTIDYAQLLKDNYSTNIIDYLQLDIEPAENTFNCMLRIPFDDYKFRVITYEHDEYVDPKGQWQHQAKVVLESKGYQRVISNVSPVENSPFEDWYVHPELVDINRLDSILSNDDTVTKIDDFMLKLADRQI